ncbi:hypothetical protein GVN16_14325 [Emticicia sp. CRIBPO]|uniref:hypothetical protein n=1 Tax=Emticicia sp. CRIBPO TaxID=2683258 RepID=UPI0014121428|nr:hypothetical protein [Emticicia sp. CRIBPO]NBA86945.1 hypothetical protein [Emticicia sp. CRIBPO]
MKKTFVLLLLLVLNQEFGQANSSDKDAVRDPAFSEAIQRAGHFIDSLRLRQDIPGVSIGVGMSGVNINLPEMEKIANFFLLIKR